MSSSSHSIVLTQHQAAVLWQLDQCWQDQFETGSVLTKVARDISSYGWDPSLSQWEVSSFSITDLKQMLDTPDFYLDPNLRAYAEPVLEELAAVVAMAAAERALDEPGAAAVAASGMSAADVAEIDAAFNSID